MKKNPVICAIDKKDVAVAKKLCENLLPHIGMVKLGLEFFVANGPQGVREIAKIGMPIFLDLKLHDIPNTVAEAARAAVSLDIDILTIHASGGKNMMRAAADAVKDEAAKTGKKAPILAGITVLTSMDAQDLADMNVGSELAGQVVTLAKLAKESGLDGVVCSAHELEKIKKSCGRDFITIVPGIRSASADLNDQKRVMTPIEAVDKGADFLVIGRPITTADDPAKAAADIKISLGV